MLCCGCEKKNRSVSAQNTKAGFNFALWGDELVFLIWTEPFVVAPSVLLHYFSRRDGHWSEAEMWDRDTRWQHGLIPYEYYGVITGPSCNGKREMAGL